MLVCLACYEERVAALLETATQLRLYRQEQAGLAFCDVVPAPQAGVLALADQLAASGVMLLICGGLSGCALSALRQCGVAVAPWVGGAADEVAAAYGACGQAGLDAFRLPGCGRGGCQGRRLGLGCRGRAFRFQRARKLDTKGSAPHD